MNKRQGQTAVEYLLSLGVVVTLVLVLLNSYLPRTRQASNQYLQRVGNGIVGEPNPCGDGVCDPTFEGDTTCCVDCNPGGDCDILPPEEH